MTAECFPRRLRLLSATDFKQVFASACKAGNPHLTILVRANGLAYPRLGMAISRKAVRRAVARNRIKRQLREYFRHHQQQIGNFDLVILCKPGIDKLDKAALRDSVANCFAYMFKRCKPTCINP
ncbi:MAG: ribonuclease P protein component [Chromatiales bacterium]|nr:ribonuclease P protein component [Gammaproteobacteria bacterium]MBW6475948.1 ribonuclease P protein component [Chromatiales bacterium]